MSKKKKRPIKRKIADGRGTIAKASETKFEPHTCVYGANIIYVDGIFTKDDCEDIIEYHHTWKSKGGKITEQNPETREVISIEDEYRICTLYCPPDGIKDSLEGLDWLHAKLLDAITGVNQDYYKFDIEAFIEAPNLMRYDADTGGHYNYHLDIGIAKPNCWRKLSYSLMLNDDFEGGKLGFKTGKGVVEYEPTVGRIVIFPSYILHKVFPVTSGTRWALVGWAHGASFR